MRSSFLVCHSSTRPCIFHSFHSNAICHRQRSKTKARASVKRAVGTLVITIVHPAQSRHHATFHLLGGSQVHLVLLLICSTGLQDIEHIRSLALKPHHDPILQRHQKIDPSLTHLR